MADTAFATAEGKYVPGPEANTRLRGVVTGNLAACFAAAAILVSILVSCLIFVCDKIGA